MDDTSTPSSYRVTADELRQFIERFERLEAEKKDIAEQQKEVMAEAKARGYDTKVLRKVVALRKRDADDIAEEEAMLEMYKYLGTPDSVKQKVAFPNAGDHILASPLASKDADGVYLASKTFLKEVARLPIR